MSDVSQPVLDAVRARVAEAGLVVLTGGPEAGRTTALRSVAAGDRGPVFTGGGLATLRHLPGLALARAVRARLPDRDAALAAEAVRTRIRDGLLVLDDVHLADALTLAVLPLLAERSRVLVALRTPSGLPAAAERTLRTAAAQWTPVPPLGRDAARALARRVAPGLDDAGLTAVLDTALGAPLAIRVLADGRPATRAPPATPRKPTPRKPTSPRPAPAPPFRRAAATDPLDAGAPAGGLERAVATAIGDLPRAARTALAALGLLGRPAPPALLGRGLPVLLDAGWAGVDGPLVTPTPTSSARSPPRPAGRRAGRAAPSDRRPAGRQRRRRGGRTRGRTRRRPGGGPSSGRRRRAAGGARLRARHRPGRRRLGRGGGARGGAAPRRRPRRRARRRRLPRPDGPAGCARPGGRRGGPRRRRTAACLRRLDTLDRVASATEASPADRVRAAVLRGEALLQAGRARAATAALAAVNPAVAPAPFRAEHTRVELLAALAHDPDAATRRAAALPPDLRAAPAARVAVAAVAAHRRAAGWVTALGAAGDAAQAAAGRSTPAGAGGCWSATCWWTAGSRRAPRSRSATPDGARSRAPTAGRPASSPPVCGVARFAGATSTASRASASTCSTGRCRGRRGRTRSPRSRWRSPTPAG